MNVTISPGRYVLAVSGGVDSVVLLHVLAQKAKVDAGTRPPLRLTVAHFDHGIRADAQTDRLFVQALAREYGLPFAYDKGRLGAGASEAAARAARYEFLEKVRRASRSQAIITAHHQDDLLETAILNLLRGTGRKGLVSLRSRPDLLRPLLDTPKRDLLTYAQQQQLEWREDSTNSDQKYQRNYVRKNLLSRFDEPARERLRTILARQQQINDELDELLINQLHLQPERARLQWTWFASLPHDISKEVLATWLRLHGLGGFDSKTLERLTVAAKVTQPGKRIDVFSGWFIIVQRDSLALEGPER